MKEYLVQFNIDTRNIIVAKLNHGNYSYDNVYCGKSIEQAMKALYDAHNDRMNREYSDFIEAKTKLSNIREN